MACMILFSREASKRAKETFQVSADLLQGLRKNVPSVAKKSGEARLAVVNRFTAGPGLT